MDRRSLALKIRFYHGQDDDLIRWMSELDGQPYGAKSQAVKEALRRGLATAPPSPAVDLAEIRAVVEAAVESALARLEGVALVRSASESDPEDETERLLGELGEALML